MRGRLIVFEGLDGAGKTTQIDLLSRYLKQKGFPVIITSWNSSRLISKAIKRAKKAQLLTPYLYSALHAADFMYRLENTIIPSLHEGYIVIADRYAYTGLARDLARNVDRRWIENMYALAPQPDLAFYCKTSIEETLERILDRNRGEQPSYYESGMDVLQHDDPQEAFLQFQAQVASEYEWIAKEHHLLEIDTTASIEDTHQYVVSIVEDRLKVWDETTTSLQFSEKLPHAIYQAIDRPGKLQMLFHNESLVPHSYPGKLVVIEGADTAATARQANLLYNELIARGYDTRLAVSGNSWVGIEVTRKAIRKTMLSLPAKVLLSVSEIALYYEQVIVPSLQSGAIVIADGYIARLVTSYVAAGLRPEWFETLCHVFPIKPDRTIFLDVPLSDLIKKKIPQTGPAILHSGLAGGLEAVLQQTMIDLYRNIAEAAQWQRIASSASEKELHHMLLDDISQTILSHITCGEPDSSLREVFELFSHYDREFDHPRKVAELAVSLFDQTVHLHRSGQRERKMLFYAAYLHDIGHALSEKQHEEFTYEAIMREHFQTISDNEKEIIANIACLHRQPFSKMKFDHLARLSGEHQILVKKLAALLRIADALEESGKRVVHDVRCYEEHEVIYIDIHAVSKALPERAAVLRKADMFERVFQKPVVVARNWREKRARQAQRSRLPETDHEGK
ncbi:MAG: dTMP kinase [Ignavibacteria bacterium]|nr:dTMP kinase [Ignavibacteria bacterium]MBI3765367.1 dTMP kinase [Ignavibacteriales bacterium]